MPPENHPPLLPSVVCADARTPDVCQCEGQKNYESALTPWRWTRCAAGRCERQRLSLGNDCWIYNVMIVELVAALLTEAYPSSDGPLASAVAG